MCGDLNESGGGRGDVTEGVGSESYFDQAAKTWDDNPMRLELAQAVAQAISCAIAFRPEMQIMDFGCGTGLIARALAPKVATVTAADTSTEMVAVLKTKAQAAGLAGIQPLLLDDGYASGTNVCYDAIVSSMVLHHIEDLSALVKQFVQWCRPGGWLALADLEPEDGTFHRSGQQIVHHGIDPTRLASQLKAAGFAIESIQTVHTIRRPPEGETVVQDYPVFLLVAQRSPSQSRHEGQSDE